MSNLFEKSSIGRLEIENRFVLSAAYDSSRPVDDFINLAKGGVGLMISGGAGVGDIAAFENIIRAIQRERGKIVLQIHTYFAGLFGLSKDSDPVAISELLKDSIFFNSNYKNSKHHAATEDEIEKIINSHIQAAIIAKNMGADGVQIHSAHHSFLSQVLSPITNKRTDRWGGTIENRVRMHKAIIEGMRSKLGKDYPLLIKVGIEDALPGGLKSPEGIEIAKLLASYGVDAIEISQGLLDFRGGTPMKGHIKTRSDEAYFRSWGRSLKKSISVPIILTGGIRSFETAQSVLDNHEADFIGMCRPFIREPNLIQRWQHNDLRKSACISCNECMKNSGLGLECPLRLNLHHEL